MPNESQQAIDVSGKTHRDGHIRHRIFQDQVPADDPGNQFAQRRVRIGVRAARDGNHRGQFRVAQARQAADDRHGKKGNRNCRARSRPPRDASACLPCISTSSRGAFSKEGNWTVSPAAAVPVRTKMPLPMMAPTPRAVRLSHPRVFLSRRSGWSASEMSWSMLFVRKNCGSNRHPPRATNEKLYRVRRFCATGG